MLHVGTCGYSYRDWVGPFYPIGTKAPTMLEFYAMRFTAVEIDTTYYAIPKPSLLETMARRTPPEFRFSVKAPGSVTHIPVETRPSTEDLMAFEDCVAPLRSAGKLGAVLAQFPGAFRPGREAFARLELLRHEWSSLPLVAEFRHRDWQKDASVRIVRSLGLGWCNVDEPRLESLMSPDAVATSHVGYVRFHGRNAAKWWKQERSAAERYDYLYTPDELEAWLPRIAEIVDGTRETFVFFNNHRNAQAASNARQMALMLGASLPESAAESADPQLSLLDR